MTYGQQVVDNIQNIVGCNSALATVEALSLAVLCRFLAEEGLPVTSRQQVIDKIFLVMYRNLALPSTPTAKAGFHQHQQLLYRHSQYWHSCLCTHEIFSFAVVCRFLAEEGLPMTYRQQVVEYILNLMGRNSALPSAGTANVDPFTSSGAYIPDGSAFPAPGSASQGTGDPFTSVAPSAYYAPHVLSQYRITLAVSYAGLHKAEGSGRHNYFCI